MSPARCRPCLARSSRPISSRGGQEQRAEVHDVRDVVLSSTDLLRDAQALRRGVLGKLVYSRRRVFSLHAGADRFVQRLADRASAAVVSDAFERVLRRREWRQLHRSLLHGHAQPHLAPAAGEQPYKNAFGTEIALFRTSEGGMSRMAVSWDTPGFGGEMGRVRGQRGSCYEKFQRRRPT